MSTVIAVEELTKRYGTHVAVDDVGFSVMEGEIFDPATTIIKYGIHHPRASRPTP